MKGAEYSRRMMSGRDAMLMFIGILDAVFGAVFILAGMNATLLHNHGAVGIHQWVGVLLVLVGLGIIVAVLTRERTRRREYLNIHLGSLILNLVAMILSACIIGFYTWGAWAVLSIGVTGAGFGGTGDAISIYSTVILMAALIFIISMMALFMDCCSYALYGSPGGGGDYGVPARPRYYDGHYGPPPAHVYKP